MKPRNRASRKMTPLIESIESRLLLASTIDYVEPPDIGSSQFIPKTDVIIEDTRISITGSINGYMADGRYHDSEDNYSIGYDTQYVPNIQLTIPNLSPNYDVFLTFIKGYAQNLSVSGAIEVENGYKFSGGGTLSFKAVPFGDPGLPFYSTKAYMTVNVTTRSPYGDLVSGMPFTFDPLSYMIKVDVSGNSGTPPVMVQPMGSFTAYRPIAPPINYGLHPMSRAEMANLGVGIRVNGDDDNQNKLPDFSESFLAFNEDDLIRFDTALFNHGPDTLEYVVTSSNPIVKIWNSPTKSHMYPIMTTTSGTSSIIPQSDSSFWVEWAGPTGGEATLSLQTYDIANGVSSTLHSTQIHTFKSDIIYYGGEAFTDTSILGYFGVSTDPPAAGDGSMETALQLYNLGYDVHFYNPKGFTSFNEIDTAKVELLNAVRFRGVKQISIIGYSHGAGSGYLLSEEMVAHKKDFENIPIVLSIYVDAIKNKHVNRRNAETRRPLKSKFHLNYYEIDHPGIFGDSGNKTQKTNPRFNINVNRLPNGKNVAHGTIDEFPIVQTGIVSYVRLKLIN